MTDRNKRITIGVLAFILFVLPIILALVYKQVYSSTITLTYAPKAASAKINGKVASSGDNQVTPGDYEVLVEMKGFGTYKKKVSVKPGEKLLVEAVLEPNDPSTANWYTDNIEDYSIAQGIGDRAADRDYEKMIQDYPIVKILPLYGLYSTYTVSYGISPTDSGKYAIYVKYKSEKFKQEAIDEIKNKGYSLDKYEVIYNKEDPLEVNGATITGDEGFSKRGMDSDMVGMLQHDLLENYTVANGERVTSIEISEDISHVIADDGLSDSYTGIVRVNNKFDKKLIVTLTETRMIIKISEVNGSNESVIFEDDRY